jgi:hypothetical protein
MLYQIMLRPNEWRQLVDGIDGGADGHLSGNLSARCDEIVGTNPDTLGYLKCHNHDVFILEVNPS